MDFSCNAGRAICLCAAVLLMAGCGGAGTTGDAPLGAMTKNRTQTASSSSGALIYATGGCGGTCVFSYPAGKMVGSLDASGSSVCSDSSGNVFIPDNNQVVEYAHGGTNPVATLSLPGKDTSGCAVDAKTGNLAVVFRGNTGDIAIFLGAQGQPMVYGSGISSAYCGYDDAGNLYVDGYSHEAYGLSELPSGESTFSQLSVSQSVGDPGQVQWDGTYITWESVSFDDPVVSRLTISGSDATIVGSTQFKGIKRHAVQSWIHGNRIIIPYTNRGPYSKKLSIWSYPKGGKIVKALNDYEKHFLAFQGVALSVSAP